MLSSRPFKELVIISGKGGTGKTSLVASLVSLNETTNVIADCDVDAADLHLILAPKIKQRDTFSGGKMASIVAEKCSGCGKCAELCRFGAIVPTGNIFRIEETGCEGCGVCAHFCPEQAIDYSSVINGEWFVSNTRCGPLVHAKLGIAEENSGKLVSLLRARAKKIALAEGHKTIIIDGAPGIGCPVIASITGANLVLIVTEPTLSGLHDLERVGELAGHFKIPVSVCINKFDLNEDVTRMITTLASVEGWKVCGKISYDPIFTKAQVAGVSVVEYGESRVADEIRSVWNEVVTTFA